MNLNRRLEPLPEFETAADRVGGHGLFASDVRDPTAESMAERPDATVFIVTEQ